MRAPRRIAAIPAGRGLTVEWRPGLAGWRVVWEAPTPMTAYELRAVARLLDALEARGREPGLIKLSPARLRMRLTAMEGAPPGPRFGRGRAA